MLTRGEGQLVDPSCHPSRRKIISSPQASRRHSPSIAHEERHEIIPTEDEDLRKDFMEMREMMEELMEERNTRLQGEGSNPSNHKGDSGDKTPKWKWREWCFSTTLTSIFLFFYQFTTSSKFSKGTW
jgi:hypothetical protein